MLAHAFLNVFIMFAVPAAFHLVAADLSNAETLQASIDDVFSQVLLDYFPSSRVHTYISHIYMHTCICMYIM